MCPDTPNRVVLTACRKQKNKTKSRNNINFDGIRRRRRTRSVIRATSGGGRGFFSYFIRLPSGTMTIIFRIGPRDRRPGRRAVFLDGFLFLSGRIIAGRIIIRMYVYIMQYHNIIATDNRILHAYNIILTRLSRSRTCIIYVVYYYAQYFNRRRDDSSNNVWGP